MKEFGGRLAVVTGGGTGMGRELCRALVRDGCHVATCDLSEEAMAETRALCERDNPAGVRFTTHRADVSSEADLQAFRDDLLARHQTDRVHLLFNNAGIGGGGSFVAGDRTEWERTFGVCWYGVYYGCRTFLPLLLAADEAHIINTSSVNGFWATLGPHVSHTAYSAAKFAVKGFSEALITDLRLNAPHVKVSVVMPGHIGTSIAINTAQVLGKGPEALSSDELAAVRHQMVERGLPVGNEPDDHIRALLRQRAQAFRDEAPCSARDAARIILDGVRENRWRILVGEDARRLDAQVRETPESAYELEFLERLNQEGHFQGVASVDE